MSFGLLRKDESIHLSCQGWFQAMRLAKMHGWKPAGPEGNYETNDGQTVCEEEAVSMGEALKNALPDIPDEDVLSIKGPVFPGDQVNPYEWFSGPRKQRLSLLIEYCRGGSFAIH